MNTAMNIRGSIKQREIPVQLRKAGSSKAIFLRGEHYFQY
jgi:hypothetical protein